jgi:hypothetical protein
LGNLSELIYDYLLNHDLALFRHPDRDSIEKEISAIFFSKNVDDYLLLKQAEKYLGVLRNFNQLYECSFIWRKHKNKSIEKLESLWWKELDKFVLRDQVSFPYVLKISDIKPTILNPYNIGSSRNNLYLANTFNHNPKKNKKINFNEFSNIIFFFDKNYEYSGSTKFRVKQLSILFENYFDCNRVKVLTNIDETLQNNLVILSKSILKKINEVQISLLKINNNKLIIDPVDESFDELLINYIDGIICSSLSQYKFYKLLIKKRKLDIKVFHILHHVDLELINRDKEELLNFKALYFGNQHRTFCTSEISKFVDFKFLNTKDYRENDFLVLDKYNFHYCIDSKKSYEQFKPLTKVFLAAEYNAIVIIGRHEESQYYLGKNYPYYVDEINEINILGVLAKSKNDFHEKNRRYLLAKQIMKDVKMRSSQNLIKKEIKYFISNFY